MDNGWIDVVQRAQQGDPNAQWGLYEGYAKQVYFLAIKLLGNQADAEDAVQEVFISVFRSLPTLQNPESFVPWLNRICANKCTDILRKRGELPVDLQEEVPGAEPAEQDVPLLPQVSLDDNETRKMIMEVVDALPVPQRACVLYFYYEQLTVAQIAEIMAVSEGTVKSRLSSARHKIQVELERKNREEGIKLYGTALALGPILREAAARMDFSQNIQMGIWRGIQAGFGPAAMPPAAASPSGRAAGATAKGATAKGGIVKIMAVVCSVGLVLGVAAGFFISTYTGNPGLGAGTSGLNAGASSLATAPSSVEIASAVQSLPASAAVPSSAASSGPIAPALSEDFYISLAEIYWNHSLFFGEGGAPPYSSSFGDTQPIVNMLETEAHNVVWHVILMDEAAERSGHPTPFRLSQYARPSSMGAKYEIPAPVLQQALLAWFDVAYDVTTFNEVEKNSGMQMLVWNADTDVVTYENGGVGGGPIRNAQVTTDSVEGNVVTTTVSWPEDPPFAGGRMTFVLRENEDGTYTLLRLQELDPD